MNQPLSVAMFVAGLVLLIGGILREFRSKFVSFGPLTRTQRWLFIGLGAVLMAAGPFADTGSREHQTIRDPQSSTLPTTSSNGATARADPRTLIAIVRNEQRRAVRESYGENAGECFTDDDLAAFRTNRTAEQIVTRLRRDPQFLNVVAAIKALGSTEREDLLAAASAERRKTWRELGHISREGQTEAGRQAETLVALAIVAEVQRLVP